MSSPVYDLPCRQLNADLDTTMIARDFCVLKFDSGGPTQLMTNRSAIVWKFNVARNGVTMSCMELDFRSNSLVNIGKGLLVIFCA